jgi:hypothetical protein
MERTNRNMYLQIAQLDTIFRICGQSASTSRVFDSDTNVLGQILHYGTSFERDINKDSTGEYTH